jgi:glyoxylase I family protein
VIPPITGRLVPTLTVRDLRASADWYRDLLGAVERAHVDERGVLVQVILREPRSGTDLCLVSHGRSEPFDETRCGLDHLEFVVAEPGDLTAWATHLDALGVAHSGVKTPDYSDSAMLTFRDPDGIQLEFYWSPR